MAITSGSGNVIEVMLQLKDEMSGRLDKAAGSLGSVASKMALVGGAALTAGAVIGNFVARMAEQVEQLDNLSASTGVSTRNLQVLQFAFRQGGVDAAALSQGMNFLNRAIANNDPALAKLGITSRDTFSAFMQAAEGIRNTTDSTERARLVFEVFGRGGAQLIPVLNQVASNFGGVATAAEQSGNVLGGEALQRLRDVDTAMDKLQATAKGLGNELAVGLAGPVANVTNAFAQMLLKMREIQREGEEGRSPGSDFLRRAGGLDKLVDGHVPRGGGANWEQPTDGFGEMGPGGRGTVERGTAGNMDAIQAAYDAQTAAAKRATEAALVYQRVLHQARNIGRSVEYGPLTEDETKFGPLMSDQTYEMPGLRGPMGAPNQMLQIGPMVDEAKEHLTTFSELMENTSTDIIQSFEIIGSHMHRSIVNVFTNLTNKAQTWRSAIVGIFQAAVQGILQAIGELVAAQITKLFLKLVGIALSAITGNPYIAIVAGTDPSTGLPKDLPLPTGAVGMPDGGAMSMAGGPAGRGGDTYNIYMSPIEAKGALQAIISPTGSFRGANTRLAEMAAVS